MQTFIAPLNTNYKLEVWGGQGGGYVGIPDRAQGGKGGYAQGFYSMFKDQVIYISVGGGNGISWNGGGLLEGNIMCGGGATSIQKSLLSDGQLYHYESVKETDVLIVAGGGGGSEWYYSYTDLITPVGGSGGGINGEDGSMGYLNDLTPCPGAKGGTQTTGGKSTAIDARSGTQTIVDGSFGRGGYTLGGDGGGQGGGGWYGGGAADYAGGGGGGSGHIGTMCTNGSMQSGVHEGNGYCMITWQQLP